MGRPRLSIVDREVIQLSNKQKQKCVLTAMKKAQAKNRIKLAREKKKKELQEVEKLLKAPRNKKAEKLAKKQADAEILKKMIAEKTKRKEVRSKLKQRKAIYDAQIEAQKMQALDNFLLSKPKKRVPKTVKVSTTFKKKATPKKAGSKTAKVTKPSAKKARKPSEYNVFVGQQMRQGLSMKEAAAKWRSR